VAAVVGFPEHEETRTVNRVRDALKRIGDVYAGDEQRPLRGYLVAMGTYGGLVCGLFGLGKATGARLPERFELGDTLLLALATHKASRLLAMDAIASPLRAPFTRYEGPAGEAEVVESVRGNGLQHAAGELISCPFCLGLWTATGLTAGMVLAPRLTRLATTMLTSVAVSDTLHIGYDGAKQLLHQVGE
jgi:hypothetical protein